MTSDRREFTVTDLPGNSIYKLVSAKRGTFLANPNDLYIGRALVRYGEFSELEWLAIDQLTPPGGQIIEVGANIGAHTVSLAKKAGKRGFVYAYEMQPVVFQNLCANLALNGLTNVQAVNAGCGDTVDEFSFPAIDYSVEGNFGAVSLSRLPLAQPGAVRVPFVCLDDVYPVGSLSLVKVDAEGMESEVLRGARQLIGRFKPFLYVENDRPEKSEELISLLIELDYRAWWHFPRYFNPENFAENKENIYGKTVSMNMICIPKSRKSNMGNLREVTLTAEHPKVRRL